MSRRIELIWNEDKTKIVKRIVTDNPEVGSFYSEEVARSLEKYIPMQTGMLANTYDTTPKTITYIQPYAHRLYTGTNFKMSTEMNENASAYWDRRLTSSDKERIARSVTKFLKGKG